MKRRDFIKLGGMAAIPMISPRLAFASDASKSIDNILVCIFQRGGADGLNMIVPSAEARYHDLRPRLAIPEPGAPGGALDLDGFFGLHPSLEPLLSLYRDGELGIVHAAGSPHESRSHFDAQDFMESGSTEKGLVHDGWLNRHLQVVGEGPSAFSATAIGTAVPLSLQGSAAAIGLSGVSDFDLVAPGGQGAGLRAAILGLHGNDTALDREARQVFDAIDVLQEIEQGDPDPANGAVYPATAFGQQLAGLARVIRGEVGLRVACVETGGWDHHDREADQLSGMLAEFGAALSAFHADLGALMSRVTVVTMTEFGRRVAENASQGTDHGHGSVMLALGAGVNGGMVHGEWPGLSEGQLNRGDLEVTTDFRTVLAELLANRLGNSEVDAVFPGFTGPTALGLFQAGS